MGRLAYCERGCFQVEGYLIFSYRDSKAVPCMLAF